MSPNFHVISPLFWIQSAFRDYFDKSHITDTSLHRTGVTNDVSDYAVRGWNLSYNYGFEPAQDLAEDEAVWITPDLLIALNGWRNRHNMESLLFEAPPANWLSSLPSKLTGRKAVCADVAQIRTWTTFPDGLGARPWSQLGNGRVPEFRAARRTLPQLQDDLRNAPNDSLISVNAHIPTICEEWAVIINHGAAVAASGYCVHTPLGEEQSDNTDESHNILTVFDEAEFHDACRPVAEAMATAAAQASHLSNVSITVGFHSTSPAGMTGNTNQVAERQLSGDRAPKALITDEETTFQPSAVVVEAAPVWCTTPYPYRSIKEITGFLEAIADSRIRQEPKKGDQECRQLGIKGGVDGIYLPDPWMVRRNVHRYDRF
ncbi:hypothetical protein FHX77_000447 [Bifidobacterium commune]|uniref:Uncharacterized protein n=1 Tax=Bifidobacterium commune TaxID=1505727 RepID=A0A1C4H3N0_9BIFI|nr:hypothetical protein [Bifidobacterium commune]MBB2955067.1 hypothetical protein [Bifidobacterium commune]SCC79381.1 hypothetical protein GA0061077_0701 [Bifidobacterium commune]